MLDEGTPEVDGLAFLPVPVSLADPLDVSAVSVLLADLRPVLVIIDTQARVTLGLDENSSRDMGRFVEMLRGTGFSVYARPKLTEGDDIDEALLDHLRERAASAPLAEVLLASADQYRDAGDDSLGELAARLPLTVLGFREFNRAAMAMDGVRFIDLEDIPGLFAVPLDRETPLEALPPEGAWLPARRSLREIHG